VCVLNGFPFLNKLCAWRHNMLPPVASWQYLLFARWHLFRHVGYLIHQQQVDLWPFDLESGVRVKCDVGYLCANFNLPTLLCSRVRPDVRDRQTNRRQTDRRQTSDRRQTKASLNASALWGRRHNNAALCKISHSPTRYSSAVNDWIFLLTFEKRTNIKH